MSPDSTRSAIGYKEGGVFRILRGQALFVPFLKKGNAKNFCFFERTAFKMDEVKERQFLVGVRGQVRLQNSVVSRPSPLNPRFHKGRGDFNKPS